MPGARADAARAAGKLRHLMLHATIVNQLLRRCTHGAARYVRYEPVKRDEPAMANIIKLCRNTTYFSLLLIRSSGGADLKTPRRGGK